MWVVLKVMYDDGAFEDVAIAVSITSYTPRTADDACVLDVGDHPYIRWKSFAYYARLHHATLAEMKAACAGAQKQASVDPALLSRLLVGAENSEFTKRSLKALLKRRV